MPSLKELRARGDVSPPVPKLSKDDKEAWAKAGNVFDLIHVQAYPEGEKGPYHTYQVEMLGEPYLFDLQDSGGRGVNARELAAACASEPVTGLRLRALSKKAGNSFIVIDEAEEG